MKFGLFYLPTYLPDKRDAYSHLREIEEQVIFADQIGIDYVWFVEHHIQRHGGISSENFPILTYLAAKTSRIRLGTGATILPLNDPVRVAEMGALLDNLSDGRFDFGIGRGFSKIEFDAFGVDMKESRERVEEGVDLIKKAWSEPRLTYEGKFRSIQDALMLPPIYQKPHPPIWVACFMTPASFEWTAKEGYNLMYVAYHSEPEEAQERINWYLDALKKYGRAPQDYEVMCCYHAYFMEEDDVEELRATVEIPMEEYSLAGAEAQQKAPDPEAYKGYESRQEYHKSVDFNTYFPNRTVMGGPERVIERIRSLEEMGITQVAFIVDYGSLPHEKIMNSLKVFSEKVLPEISEVSKVS